MEISFYCKFATLEKLKKNFYFEQHKTIMYIVVLNEKKNEFLFKGRELSKITDYRKFTINYIVYLELTALPSLYSI